MDRSLIMLGVGHIDVFFQQMKWGTRLSDMRMGILKQEKRCGVHQQDIVRLHRFDQHKVGIETIYELPPKLYCPKMTYIILYSIPIHIP